MSRRLVLLVAAAGACHLGDPAAFDASGDAGREGEARRDADGADASDGDDLDGEASGPITVVVYRVELLPERRCDLDGDGVQDNALAGLGEPLGSLLLRTLNVMLEGQIELGHRVVFHFPWIDDRRTPHDPQTIGIVYDGDDRDDPPDPTDDFSGTEPLVVPAGSLDGCGEPRMHFADVSIDQGRLDVEYGTLAIPLRGRPALVRGASGEGALGAGGSSFEVTLCGYTLARELGDTPGLDETGLSILEILLSGGAGLGMPAVPGVSPDVDVDGDGLERFELDAENRIEQCVDGDGTVVGGTDCFRDERMADGFSLVVEATAVPAVFGGRKPGWEEELEGAGLSCDAPPEESLWDYR